MTQNEIKIPAFFAENGLTATSANHLSNIAKENYMAIERQMAKRWPSWSSTGRPSALSVAARRRSFRAEPVPRGSPR